MVVGTPGTEQRITDNAVYNTRARLHRVMHEYNAHVADHYNGGGHNNNKYYTSTVWVRHKTLAGICIKCSQKRT